MNSRQEKYISQSITLIFHRWVQTTKLVRIKNTQQIKLTDIKKVQEKIKIKLSNNMNKKERYTTKKRMIPYKRCNLIWEVDVIPLGTLEVTYQQGRVLLSFPWAWSN